MKKFRWREAFQFLFCFAVWSALMHLLTVTVFKFVLDLLVKLYIENVVELIIRENKEASEKQTTSM